MKRRTTPGRRSPSRRTARTPGIPDADVRDARAAKTRRPLARGPVTRHTVARIEGHERIGAGLISSTIRCTNASAVPACATKSRPPPPAWSLARCRVHCTRSVPTTAAGFHLGRARRGRGHTPPARLHCLPSPRVKTTKVGTCAFTHSRRGAVQQRPHHRDAQSTRVCAARSTTRRGGCGRRRHHPGVGGDPASVRRPCLRRTSGEYQQRQLSRALASEVARDVDTDSSQ